MEANEILRHPFSDQYLHIVNLVSSARRPGGDSLVKGVGMNLRRPTWAAGPGSSFFIPLTVSYHCNTDREIRAIHFPPNPERYLDG